jgi:hypothetical protein
VEIRERVEEVRVPYRAEVEVSIPVAASSRAKPLLFSGRTDDELLGYGVPVEWLADVRQADEDSLLELAGHLPAEAAEALLELATGGKPQVTPPTAGVDPYSHPDAQRRFRVMNDVEELERALAFPWEHFNPPLRGRCTERNMAAVARLCAAWTDWPTGAR